MIFMKIGILSSDLVQWTTIMVSICIKISRRIRISNILPITIPIFARPHAATFGWKIKFLGLQLKNKRMLNLICSTLSIYLFT